MKDFIQKGVKKDIIEYIKNYNIYYKVKYT